MSIPPEEFSFNSGEFEIRFRKRLVGSMTGGITVYVFIVIDVNPEHPDGKKRFEEVMVTEEFYDAQGTVDELAEKLIEIVKPSILREFI